jgi:hypothetical protein
MEYNLPQGFGPQRAPKGNLRLFLESALSAGTKEMIGRDPSYEVSAWRQESPVAGPVSQFAGMVGPYAIPATGAYGTALKAIPFVGRGLKTAEVLQKTRPVLGGAFREMSRYGPFELARTGVTAMSGGDWQGVAKEGLFNYILAGGVGAGFGVFRGVAQTPATLGVEAQARRIDPTIDLNAPMQLRLQKFRELLSRTDLDEDFARQLSARTRKLERVIAAQAVPAGRQPVQKMERSGAQQALNRIWAPRDDKLFLIRPPVMATAKTGWGKKAYQDVAQQMDFYLPEHWQEHAYLPRIVQPKGQRASGHLEGTLDRTLERIEPGLWVGREADGMFIVARRMRDELLPDGAVRSHPERVFITKTDLPGAWAPNLAKFGNAQGRQIFHMEPKLPEAKILKKIPLGEFAERAYPSMVRQAVLQGEIPFETTMRNALKGLVPESQVAKLQALAQGQDVFARMAKTFLSPTITQFTGRSGSRRAASIMAFAKAMMDRAAGLSAQSMSGTSVSAKGSLWKGIWVPEERINSLYNAIDALDEKSLMEISRVMWTNPKSLDGYSQPTKDFINKFLFPIDQRQVKMIEDMQKAFGVGDFLSMQNHYMLSRMWVGPLRIELRDPKGIVRAYAAGHSPQEVKYEAELIKKIARQEDNLDLSFNPKAIRRPQHDEDLRAAMAIQKPERALRWTEKAREPMRFKEREGALGGLGYTRSLDKKELRELLGKNIRESHNYMAMQIVRHKIAPDMRALLKEDPQIAALLNQRLNDLEGVKGPVAKAVEKAVDQVLTPILGTSAMQIARGTNELMFQLTLGFGNVGFAALNALTFVQTALPEAAFALRAVPASIQSLYGISATAAGNKVRTVRYLEPGRILKYAMGQLSKPDEDLARLVIRAKEEGIVSPRLAEEVFGPDSNIVNHFKQFWKGDKNVLDFTREASAYLPARTEELARMISFIMGHKIAKDFYGLQGEALYRMASQFTSNSMYRYTTADRSRLFTGAFGTTYGLFKNWVFHYIANTARFAGEGIYRGNWSPLLWQQAGAVGVAGLGGSALYPVAEGFASLAGDKTALEQMYSGFGLYEVDTDGVSGKFTDAMFYGLPAFLNISLQHRASVPGAIPSNDIEQLYSIALTDRAGALGKLFMESMDRHELMGDHPANDRRVRDAMAQAFLPRTFQSAYAKTEEGGLRSIRSGNLLFSDASQFDQMANMLGVRSVDVAKAYSATRELFAEQESFRKEISYFGEVLTQARQAGDARAEWEVYRQATVAGLPWERIARSADARLAKRDTDLIERSFEEAQRQAKLRLLGLE